MFFVHSGVRFSASRVSVLTGLAPPIMATAWLEGWRMSVASFPCDMAEISVRCPFCLNVFETLPQNLLEMQILVLLLPMKNLLSQQLMKTVSRLKIL